MRGSHDDAFGHGTACSGIVHSLAPEARITSVKVLGAGLTGKAAAFLRGLAWAVEQGFDVINLSLGTTKREWALPFYEVCDEGYFKNSVIVTAANNIVRPSFPVALRFGHERRLEPVEGPVPVSLQPGTADGVPRARHRRRRRVARRLTRRPGPATPTPLRTSRASSR